MNHVLLKSNNDTSVHKSNYENITLDELNKLIGGWIEIVNIFEDETINFPKNTVVIVDEEGFIKSLDPNFFASWIVNRLIVGDVVISKGDEGGEIIGFDDAEVKNVMSLVANFKTIMEAGK